MLEVRLSIKRDYPFFREVMLAFAKLGIIVDIGKDAGRISLIKEGEPSELGTQTFIIPEPVVGLEGLEFFVSCEEKVVQNGEGIQAIIVASKEGRYIKPFYIPRSPNGFSARFSMRPPFVLVESDGNEAAIHLYDMVIKQEERRLLVIADESWRGAPKSLPNDMEAFFPAVVAAVAKANCPGCQHVHFGNVNK